MRRGLLVWVNLEPASPPEFGKTRPAVVVSNTEQNLVLSSIVVIPVSSKAPEIWPLRVGFKQGDEKTGYAVLPGIRQISKSRVEEEIGLVAEAVMSRIDHALAAYLGE